MKRATALALPLLLGAVLGGCSTEQEPEPTTDQSGAVAVTPGAPDPTDGVAGTTAPPATGGTGETGPTATDGAGAQLSRDQAAAVLASVADFPQGWSEGDDAGPEEAQDVLSDVLDLDDATVEPAGCLPLLEIAQDDRTDGAAVVSQEAEFSTGGDEGTWVEMSVSSFDGAQSDRVIDVRDDLEGCTQLTVTADDESFGVAVSELSIRQVGDEALALRLDITGGDRDVVSDVVVVAAGNTMLSWVTAGHQPMAEDLLPELVDAGLGRLADSAQ